MTQSEIIQKLLGLMGDTDVFVRLMVAGGSAHVELAIKDLIYVPSCDDEPAYMVFTLQQGLET